MCVVEEELVEIVDFVVINFFEVGVIIEVFVIDVLVLMGNFFDVVVGEEELVVEVVLLEELLFEIMDFGDGICLLISLFIFMFMVLSLLFFCLFYFKCYWVLFNDNFLL